MKHLEYLKEVASLQLDEAQCTGCGMCVNVCPHEVFTIEHRKSRILNRNRCMECGACAKNCSFGALSVTTGVGCAAGIIQGILRGTEPTCDCSGSSSCC
ncbi:MAG: mercury methylation ferredoxin HgcB [Bacteroidales bacterium]|nr:mercury methylation ferredoxin HgcB [Bacteroidales bacterium]